MSSQNLGLPATPAIAKAQAKRLRTALAPDYTVGHSQALELVARVHGEPTWGRLNSLISASTAMPTYTEEGAQDAPASGRKTPVGKTLEQRAISALLSGLEKARDTAPTAKTRARTAELLKQEIILPVALEGWLDTLDTSLGGMVFDMGAGTVIELSGATEISRYQRPKAKDTTAYATTGLRPAGFAAVLVWLERLGFDTHPEIFYEAFLADIRRTKLLDEDELTCLWHARERNKFKTFETFNGGVEVEDPEYVSFTGRTGLNVRAVRGKTALRPIQSLSIFR